MTLKQPGMDQGEGAENRAVDAELSPYLKELLRQRVQYEEAAKRVRGRHHANEASWALWRLNTVGDWSPNAVDPGSPLTQEEEEKILSMVRQRPGIARDILDAAAIIPVVCHHLEQEEDVRRRNLPPNEVLSTDEWNRLDFLSRLFRYTGWLVFFWPDLGPYLALLSDRARGTGEREGSGVRMDREFVTSARPDRKEKESEFARRRLELFFAAITQPIEWKRGDAIASGTVSVAPAPLPDWCNVEDVGTLGESDPKFLIEVTEREKRLFEILTPFHAHMLPVEGAFRAGTLKLDCGKPGWLKGLVERLGRHALMSPSIWMQIEWLVDEAQGKNVSPEKPESRERVTKAKAELAGLFEQLAKQYRLPKPRTVDRAAMAKQHDGLPMSERPTWRKAEAEIRGVLEKTVERYVKDGRVILRRAQENHR